jgi:lipoyl(octanoyl) transferase
VKECRTIDLGRIAYGEAVALQQRLVVARKNGTIPDLLLFCEHPHVITLGRNGKRENLHVSEDVLCERGVEFHHTNRGGDITYHGPGQVVAYPILDLNGIRRDVVWYVRELEQSMIAATSAFGVRAFRVPGCTGVWVDGNAGGDANSGGHEKLASIGVHMSRWVTSHGFAYNVSTDLSFFDLITPCGIAGCRTTSLEKLLGIPVMRAEAIARLSQGFSDSFALELVPVDLAEFQGCPGELDPAAISTGGSRPGTMMSAAAALGMQQYKESS